MVYRQEMSDEEKSFYLNSIGAISLIVGFIGLVAAFFGWYTDTTLFASFIAWIYGVILFWGVESV